MYAVPGVVKFLKTKNRMVVTRRCGDRKRGFCLIVIRVSVGEDEEVLKMFGGDDCTAL